MACMKLDQDFEIHKQAVAKFNSYAADRNNCLINGGTDSDIHAVDFRDLPAERVLVLIDIDGWRVEFAIARTNLIIPPRYFNGWRLRTLTASDLRHALIRRAA